MALSIFCVRIGRKQISENTRSTGNKREQAAEKVLPPALVEVRNAPLFGIGQQAYPHACTALHIGHGGPIRIAEVFRRLHAAKVNSCDSTYFLYLF